MGAGTDPFTGDLSWMEGARCKGSTHLFYPPDDLDYGPALALCSECPNRRPCLTQAMHYEGVSPKARRYGMSGGYTPEQRANLGPYWRIKRLWPQRTEIL